MPAPNLATFYAGESALVTALRTALRDAEAPAYSADDHAANGPRLPVPRIDIFCGGSQDTDQVAFVPGSDPAQPYAAARRGTLTLRLVTRRASATQSSDLIGLVRRVLALPAQAIDSTNLPYHELLMLAETSLAYSVGEEPETDEHLLSYNFVLGFPPTQYPV